MSRAKAAIKTWACFSVGSIVPGNGAIVGAPLAASIADADYPPGAIATILHPFVNEIDRTGLLGRRAIMYSFPTSIDSHVSAKYQNGDWYDDAWIGICQVYGAFPDASFLDLGANIGTFTVPISLCLRNYGGEGHVIAVEAHPANVGMLKANLKVNFIKNSVLFPYAVGETSGSIVEMVAHFGNQASATVVQDGNTSNSHVKSQRGVAVELTTLDEIYHAHPELMRRVFIMKIDVEGHEGLALRGGRKFFSEAPPCVLKAELIRHWLRRKRTPWPMVLDFLSSSGYNLDDYTTADNGYEYVFQQKDFISCLVGRLGSQRSSSWHLASDVSNRGLAVTMAGGRGQPSDGASPEGQLLWTHQAGGGAQQFLLRPSAIDEPQHAGGRMYIGHAAPTIVGAPASKRRNDGGHLFEFHSGGAQLGDVANPGVDTKADADSHMEATSLVVDRTYSFVREF